MPQRQDTASHYRHRHGVAKELPDWFHDLPKVHKDNIESHSSDIFAKASYDKESTSAIHAIRRGPVYAFFRNIVRSFFKYIFTVFTSATNIFSDPLGFVWNLFVFPILQTTLLSLEFFTYVAFKTGIYEGSDWFSDEFADGYTLINWFDRKMFDSPVHKYSRKALTNPHGLPSDIPAQELDAFEDMRYIRYLNIDIAKSLLLMSALMYERNDVSWVAAETIKADRKLSDKQKREAVMALMLESQQGIHEQAEKWNMNFAGITDFTTIGGPFCGLFWPKEEDENWIVLAFKGTSPTDIGEFLVDATLDFHDGASFFGAGLVHQGFYTSLAPGAGSPADPYGDIISTIRRTAKHLKKGNEPVNLWITGHSLGAAMASLMYARLLSCPADLGPNIALRQGFVYGSPRCADGAFVSNFEFLMMRPFQNTTQALWRISNDLDIVSHIPPGLADDEQNRGNLPPHSLLNYGHFGSAGIRLIGRLKGQVRYGLGLDVKDVIDSGFTIKRGSVKGGSEVLLIEHKRESDEDRDFVMPEDQMSTRMVKILGREVDPVKMVYNAIRLAPFLSDHWPSEYWRRLIRVKPDHVFDVQLMKAGRAPPEQYKPIRRESLFTDPLDTDTSQNAGPNGS